MQRPGMEFEYSVLTLLKRMGFDAKQTKTSGDGGIDVVAFSVQPMIKGKYVIQCKDWSSPVGEPTLRDLYGVVHSERANKGILITTSSFTANAIRFAQDKPIELIDGMEYAALLEQHGLVKKSTPTEVASASDEQVKYQQGLVKLINCSCSGRDNPYEPFVGSVGQLRPESDFSFIVCDSPMALPIIDTLHGLKTMHVKERFGGFGSILEVSSYFVIRDADYHKTKLNHATTPNGSLNEQGLSEMSFEVTERGLLDPDVFQFKCLCNHETATALFEKFKQWRLQHFSSVQSPTPHSSQGCFVATAIYDDNSDCIQVRKLRRWRDAVLQKYALGRLFIAAYYRCGEKLAGFVRLHPLLKPPLRTVLDRIGSLLDL